MMGSMVTTFPSFLGSSSTVNRRLYGNSGRLAEIFADLGYEIPSDADSRDISSWISEATRDLFNC